MEKKLSYQLIDKGFFGISIRSSIWKRKKRLNTGCWKLSKASSSWVCSELFNYSLLIYHVNIFEGIFFVLNSFLVYLLVYLLVTFTYVLVLSIFMVNLFSLYGASICLSTA